MPAQSFRDVWSKVLLRVPGAPASLVQDWVQDAYERLIGRRHWAWTRRQAILSTLASRSLTLTFTQASTTVTSAAAFVATDVGRQIRVGTGPIYTIASLTDASTVVLTTAYAGANGAATATIQDIYLVMPEDFRSIEDVTDLALQRPIAWWISRETLDYYDAARIVGDSRLRVLVSAQVSQVPSLLGRITYEAWPYPSAAGSYVLNYFIRPDTLADDDLFQGVLATHTGALVTGALKEAAQWPGTLTQRNPYFNLKLATELEREFDQACKNLDVMDDDQYVMDLQHVDLSRFGLRSLSADTTYLRASDAGINDYF